ncbi:MAG TPA: protein kinase [Planctomycetota bacterium]|jgi:serine/threonine protein kinase/tetratricopeptide (TPR) repeat protein
MQSETQDELSDIQESLFGTLAVRYHFCLEEQVQDALLMQRALHQDGEPVPRLGEILMARGHITAAQIQAVLKGQLADSPRRFGEVAVALQMCQASDIDAALRVQAQVKSAGSYQRLGEILVARNVLRPHQVHAILRQQGKSIVACPGCHTQLNVSEIAPGVSVSCPQCNNVFRTPMLGENGGAITQIDVRADVQPAANEAAATGAAPQTMGPFQLGQKLGSDSSGLLYKAFDPQTGSNVALRVLNPVIVSSPGAVQRWISASEAASELIHPNVQRIVSIDTVAGQVYVVMEFVEGESLRKCVARRGRYPLIEAVDVLLQVADALSYGHANGFLHGDLRPAHVLVGFDGIVRVSGLGTPKSVSLNLRQVAGEAGDETLPLYTPPEVLLDEEKADERSDIYSLGAVGYQMLTGRPPHEGTNVLQVGLKIASQRVALPSSLNASIAPYLDRLLVKCLQPEPDDRYPSVPELLTDLRKARYALQAGTVDVPEIGKLRLRSGTRKPVSVPPAGHRDLKQEARRGKSRLRTFVSREGRHGAAKAAPVAKRPPPRLTPGSGSKLRPASPPQASAPPAATTLAEPAPFPVLAAPVQAPTPVPAKPVVVRPANTLDIGDIGLPVEPITPEQVDTEGEEEAAQAPQPLQKAAVRKHVGKPLDPGISPKAVLIGSGVVVLVVLILIIVGFARGPAVPVTVQQKDKPDTSTLETSQVVSTGNAGASSDWRLAKEYIRTNGKDFAGIVQRLESFRLKYVDVSRPAEQAEEAKTLLTDYSRQGAAEALPVLRAETEKLLQAEQFPAADRALERWKQLWRWDPTSAATAESFGQELAGKQKQMAEGLLGEALSARKQRNWDQASAIYKRIIENYATAYADAARKARLDMKTDMDVAVNTEDREAQARKAAEAKAAKETAAPARYQQLAKEMDEALKTLNFEQGKRLIDSAAPLLAETAHAADFQAIKNDYEHVLAVRDRIVRSMKASKISVPAMTYQRQQYTVLDCSETGLILNVGSGRVPVRWTELVPEEVAEVAQRATNDQNAAELLELGMLRFHIGQYLEARKNLADAKKLGADTARYLSRAEAKAQELATKPEPVAPKPPEPAPAATTPPAKDTPDNKAPAKDAAATKPAEPQTKTPAGADGDVAKALAIKGFSIYRGKWAIAEGTWQASPDPESDQPNLMSLKRTIKKDFQRISFEVRGTGEQAGVSFGKNRRFMVRPDGGWQKVVIEREGDKLAFIVDQAAKPSLEPLAPDVNANNLVTDGTMYLRFSGAHGEFRNIVIDEP